MGAKNNSEYVFVRLVEHTQCFCLGFGVASFHPSLDKEEGKRETRLRETV